MIMATASSLHQANPTTSNTSVPASSALSQVLQSDSVRRLFNQPNIVIHAIPRTNSPTAFRMVRPNNATDAEKSINHASLNGDHQTAAAKPEVSIRVINSPSEEANEAENLLPSKNNGKSEILLVPVVRKRKECGHFEPCESLVCLINVEQCEDEDGLVSPLVALNINEEEEIDAKVAKHCENNKCDALSIDHDRCRTASIELHRCDKSSLCDVCGIAFLGDETRMDHKKCRRKHIYQHNTATPTEVFKYRMRQRELQMIEAAKAKRSSDYLDPVMGLSRTMEALSKNDELIIIPKMPPFPPKMIVKPCLAPLSSSHNSIYNSNSVMNKSIFNYNNNNTNKNNNLKMAYMQKRLQSDDKHLTSEKISSIIESCKQRIELENQLHGSDTDNDEDTLPINQIEIKLSDHSSLNGATVRIVDIPNREKPLPISLPVSGTMSEKQEFMANAGLRLNNVNNIKSTIVPGIEPDNEVKAELRKINDKGLPEEPYKVVPIVELKSEPSLLHHEQGLPRFCVVPTDAAQLQKQKKITVNTPVIVPKKKKKRKDEDEKTKSNKDEDKKSLNEKESSNNKNSPNEKKNKEDKKESIPKKEENNLIVEKESLTSKVLSSSPSKFTGLVKSNKHPAEKLLCNSDNSIDVSSSNFDAKQIATKTSKLGRKRIKKPQKYRCTHCLKCFMSLDYCRQHVAQHENKPEFFCRLCDRGFMSKLIMKKHQEAEHKIGEVRCEMCNRVLSSLGKLAKHIKCPSSKERQKCPDCDEYFDSCGDLDLHMRKQHGFLICEICKRQIPKSKMMRHLMLEHSISKRRAESRFSKLAQTPGENDPIRDFELLKSEAVLESSSSKQVEVARRSSSRRRSSKDFFMCKVCERRFDSEKQYQIHVANYPMKFTPCLDCGKKFHRKVEYTEHSKICNPARFNEFNKAEPVRRKRKTNLPSDAVVLKSDKISQNSIDQKRNESLEINRCKKLKLIEKEKIVQMDINKEVGDVQVDVETEDFEIISVVKKDKDVKEDTEDKSSTPKITMETKIVNGLKQNSSDNCLESKTLDVVELKNFVQIEHNDVDKGPLLLNDKQSQLNSVKTVAFDKSLATLSSVIQDHNYQVLQ